MRKVLSIGDCRYKFERWVSYSRYIKIIFHPHSQKYFKFKRCGDGYNWYVKTTKATH